MTVTPVIVMLHKETNHCRFPISACPEVLPAKCKVKQVTASIKTRLHSCINGRDVTMAIRHAAKNP